MFRLKIFHNTTNEPLTPNKTFLVCECIERVFNVNPEDEEDYEYETLMIERIVIAPNEEIARIIASNYHPEIKPKYWTVEDCSKMSATSFLLLKSHGFHKTKN